MLLFSQMIGRAVIDAKGTTLGRLKDLVASGGSYPSIKALVVEGASQQRFVVAWEQVGEVSPTRVGLNETKRHIILYDLDERDILLSEQVLDRQLTDVDGHKVGRVNDIQLGKTNSHYRVLAVDPSTRGLLRRLGVDRAISFVGIRPEDQLVPWENLQLMGDPTPGLQVKVPGRAIPKIHPSDLADILEQLSVRESSSWIEAMDDEEAADALEEVSARRQVQILRDIDSERAADILEEMAPNDAADLLADLPAAKAAELLSLMETEESLEVRELLAYPEDSAGGIMTTEYLSMPESLTVRDAMRRLRRAAKVVENVYYIYVVNNPEEERLIGTISLRELLSSSSGRTLGEVADRTPITVKLNDEQETVAQVIAKYDLLAVPVVDAEGRLQGIVTVDEAMDVLLPAAWRKRLPRMFGQASPNGGRRTPGGARAG
jgi:magnesium transporter